VLDPGLTAVFGVGLASYAGYLFPLSPFGQKALAIGVVFIVGSINILGAKIGAGFLKVLTGLKIGTLLFIIGYGFLGGFGDLNNFTPFFAVPKDTLSAPALSDTPVVVQSPEVASETSAPSGASSTPKALPQKPPPPTPVAGQALYRNLQREKKEMTALKADMQRRLKDALADHKRNVLTTSF